MRLHPWRLAVIVPLLSLTNCGGESPTTESATTDEDEYDREELAEFRNAIPSASRLAAVPPGEAADPMALSRAGTSALANLAITSARTINAPAVAVVSTLRALTDIPPTSYDSKKQQFVWGPFDNEDGFGKVLAYIQRNPKDSDFDFAYALVRLDGNDLDTAVPVIWGGATPLAEEDDEGDQSGVGVALWDFEANRIFEQTYDPKFDSDAPRDAGRFVMLFGRNDDGDARFKFNVAVFRGFSSKDAERPEPVDADYFFGHFRAADEATLDFVDWSILADFCDADANACFDKKSDASNASERLKFRSAFLDRGVGRAEATVSEGDLESSVGVNECWDDNTDRTYLDVSVDGEELAREGTCEEPFTQTLADLAVPTLEDIEPDLLARLSCVAENGTACADK